jgi:hypothetical protein
VLDGNGSEHMAEQIHAQHSEEFKERWEGVRVTQSPLLTLIFSFTQLFFTFSIITLLYWRYMVTFTKFLQYIIFEFTPPTILYPLSHLWNSFNRSHFSTVIHEYIIFPSHSSPCILSLYPLPPSGTNPQTGCVFPFCSLFLEKRHFCLFKIVI